MSGIGKEEVVVNRKKVKSENARQKDFSSRKVWLSRWLKHLCIWGSLSHLFIDIFSKWTSIEQCFRDPWRAVEGSWGAAGSGLAKALLFPSIKGGYGDTTLVIPACGREVGRLKVQGILGYTVSSGQASAKWDSHNHKTWLKLGLSEKRESQLRNCLHQIGLSECLWGHFLDLWLMQGSPVSHRRCYPGRWFHVWVWWG